MRLNEQDFIKWDTLVHPRFSLTPTLSPGGRGNKALVHKSSSPPRGEGRGEGETFAVIHAMGPR